MGREKQECDDATCFACENTTNLSEGFRCVAEGLIVPSLWGGGETRGGDLHPRNDQLRLEEIIEFMESEWAIEKADQWDGVGSTEGPELEAKGWDREASGCEGVVQLDKLERVEDAELTDTASNKEPTELHVEDGEKPSIDR